MARRGVFRYPKSPHLEPSKPPRVSKRAKLPKTAQNYPIQLFNDPLQFEGTARCVEGKLSSSVDEQHTSASRDILEPTGNS
jgi:hypothetical protein